MENQQPNYYINQKRKIVDFLAGILACLLIWFCSVYLIGFIGQITTGYSEGALMGIYGIVFAPAAVAIISGMALIFKPKRKFIFLGALIAGIVPSILMGYCLIPR